VRVLFINENIGGHATMHLNVRRCLVDHPDIEATFLDAPAATLARRLVGASVPGLDRLDLDFQPLRAQLALSRAVNRALRTVAPVDVVHAYTQNAVLLSPDFLGRQPAVVSTDATNVLNAQLIPHRQPTRWTPTTVRATARFERRVYEAATIVVSHSEWAAQSLREDYGVDGDRIRIIPFGVEVPAAAPRLETSLPEVTFIGKAMTRKGGWRVVESFRRSLRGRAVLNLVTLEPVPAEPGVNVFNDFRPGDPRLPELLSRTAVLAFPTDQDTFGYAVLEAMAAGVPVVASRITAIPELVDDGVTGLLVDPHNADELDTALGRLVDDPARRATMGAAARHRVLERFDARVTTAQLVDVLHEAVARYTR
jgi:glycosyltransferase involved in cell wall biosynthesis